MTRFEKRTLIGLGLLVLVLTLMEAAVPKPTDWYPSYSRYHAKPLGASLVHERLKDVFPSVTNIHEPIVPPDRHLSFDTYEPHTPINRIFLNGNLRFQPEAAERLLMDVEAGDHVLLAAEHIAGILADTLNIEMEWRDLSSSSDTGDVRFIGKDRIAQGVFRYVRGTAGSHFTRYDTARTRVLAVDGSSRPVLVEMVWGEGRFVLCSVPQALTNFNLLKGKNAVFLAGVLSVLPVWPVVWDEFYKAGRSEANTPIRYLLSQPPLRWAWFIALSLVVLYIIVHARRQQRAIPVVAPPRNATRDLVHTVGRLYWHKGDHADIARKMIAHFKDDLRQRTYLRTFDLDEPTILHIAAKSGLSKEETEQRLTAIERYGAAARLSELQLLHLSNELHAFRQLIR